MTFKDFGNRFNSQPLVEKQTSSKNTVVGPFKFFLEIKEINQLPLLNLPDSQTE